MLDESIELFSKRVQQAIGIIEKLREENVNLKGHIAKLEDEIFNLKENIKMLKEERDQIKDKIDTATAMLDRLNIDELSESKPE